MQQEKINKLIEKCKEHCFEHEISEWDFRDWILLQDLERLLTEESNANYIQIDLPQTEVTAITSCPKCWAVHQLKDWKRKDITEENDVV